MRPESDASKPRIEALHGSDILSLIGSGMCFWIAFIGLIDREGEGFWNARIEVNSYG